MSNGSNTGYTIGTILFFGCFFLMILTKFWDLFFFFYILMIYWPIATVGIILKENGTYTRGKELSYGIIAVIICWIVVGYLTSLAGFKGF